jgi:hypothetical protein
MSTPFICHVEWGTPEPEKLMEFLSRLFGWNFQTLAPGYLIYMAADDKVSVGIMRSEQMRAGGSPSASVRVGDLDAALKKAEELGGKVVVPKTPMGVGAFAFVSTPDGNLVGLQQL